MAKELFNRYVWLIDTLQRYGRLTRREIDGLWQRSEYSDGKPMARRTFMNYRQAIQEMFDVNIECDASTYALDRVASLELSSRTFVYPDSFSPIDYFRDCFGITHDDMSAQEVVLRVPALQANYLRTLPLHESQEELDRNEHSSTFHYRLKITPDFEQEVYALGYWQAEVLSPQTLRDAVAERLSRSLACYGTAGLSCHEHRK